MTAASSSPPRAKGGRFCSACPRVLRGRRVRRAVVGRLAAIALLSVVAGSARAQGNGLSAPTGGRSTLMGNTGVALARDGSGPFLNPATIIRIDDRSLAFSVNFYTFAATHFSGWHQQGPVDASLFGSVSLRGTGVWSDGLQILPSTLCLFFTIRGVSSEGSHDAGFHRGRQKVAFCFGSTESADVGLPALPLHASTPLGYTAQAQSVNRTWNRLYAGPTYSFSPTDSLALGASIQGVYTSDSFIFDSSSVTSTLAGSAIESSLGTSGNGHAFDLVANLGGIYHTGSLTFGASVQLPAVHIFGQYDATLHEENGDPESHTATLATGQGSFSAPPPARFAVGAGLERGRLVLELDERLDLPVGAMSSTMTVSETTLATGAMPLVSRASYVVPERPVLNTSAGFEYLFSPTFSVLGGASTNLTTLSALFPQSSLGNLAPARTNSLAASFGIGSYGGGTDLLLGVQLGYGWGQAIAVNPYVIPNQWVTVDLQSYSAMIVFAGATSFRSIGRAIEKIENAVTTGDPDRSKSGTPSGTAGPAAPLAPDPGAPRPAPSNAPIELPRTGESDPRNSAADAGVAEPLRSATAADGGATAADAGAPPAPPSDDLPSPLIDPHQRGIPPK